LDAGLTLVQEIYALMDVEDEWAVLEDRGFRWWPGNLMQHVWADEPFDDDGEMLSHVHVETDYLTDIPSAELALKFLSIASSHATIAGPVLDEGSVRLASRVTVYEETLPLWVPFMGIVALTQAAIAHIEAETISQALRARVAVSHHPTSGARTSWHEGLQIIDDVIQPEGRGESVFVGEAFVQTEQQWGRRASLLTTAGSTGLTSEFPFNSSTALFQMLTDVRNPRMGSGLLSLLKLPVWPEPEAAPMLVNQLNLRERAEVTRTMFLGSWCVDPADSRTPVFVSFFPNVLGFDGAVVSNFYLYAASRARWALESVFGGDYEESWKTARPAMFGPGNPSPEPPKRRFFRRQ
jgi:hypothetical protein